MPTLSDGTPIQMQDKTYQEICEAFQEAFDDNEQEILVDIKGYISKSTGRKIDITINIAYDYHQLLLEALEHVESYSLRNADTSIASPKQWKEAKKEVETSLNDSLKGRNRNDHTSRSSEKIIDALPSVRVGYSTGLFQLQGIVEEYTIIEEGEEKKIKSRPKTLAKKEILEGTFRDTDAIGAFKTLALEKDRFSSITIGEHTFSDNGFYSDIKDDAIRVFTGDRGHSERIVLSKPGDQALIEIQGTFSDYEVIERYTHTGRTKKLTSIQDDLNIPSDALSLCELNKRKSLRSPTLIAIEKNNSINVQEVQATSKKPKTVGPSPSSNTFLEIKSKSKKLKKDETVLFVRQKSRQIIANLSWAKEHDLDLNCFIELKNGLKYTLQPLDKTFGALEHIPYVLHSGDDRCGESQEGEFLFADMTNLEHIKRIVMYATIYSGASKWDETDALVTITVPNHQTIEVPLNEQNSDSGDNTCVLCTFSVEKNELKIDRNVTFHNNYLIEHDGRMTTDLDIAYDFGLTWRYGWKD